jgi:hypothetical protein
MRGVVDRQLAMATVVGPESLSPAGHPIRRVRLLVAAVLAEPDGELAADDQLVVEYLGGVLASSRTPLGRDDRGNTLTALVSRLSTYHLRTHYILYSAAQRLLHGRTVNLQDVNQVTAQARVYLSASVYIPAMEFDETWDAGVIMTNSLYALEREKLIGFMASGSVERLKLFSQRIIEEGIVLDVTVQGVELFMWATGRGQGHVAAEFLTCDPFVVEGINVADGARLVHELAAPDSTAVVHGD